MARKGQRGGRKQTAEGDAAASGTGRAGRRRGAASQEAPGGPAEGEYRTSTGTVRLERDRYAPNAWTVFINGMPSSHIDLDDPALLDFEYMRWIATIVMEAYQDTDRRLRVLHLGGGAATLPRWIHHEYPQARQVVVELDAALIEYARQWFSLPQAPLLRIRAGDALQVVPTLTEKTRDLVIRDVFSGDQTPPEFSTPAFVESVARVLDTDGLYLLNVGDRPNHRNVRADLASLKRTFQHVAAVSDPSMLKGRRRGNIILAASHAPLPLTPSLTRDLLADPLPARVWAGEDLRRL